ncbi:hypothetical protein C2L71_03705 [Enteroscipio rubneri]|uniref:Uncharacterized protein n=1 Tax=Enteroscipio rubneri TaxID=2070686 RepID=A0A2K2UDG3_9ACTN|nr:hypothetical protein C2L71_03705 [Enteroscipio rubneri]
MRSVSLMAVPFRVRLDFTVRLRVLFHDLPASIAAGAHRVHPAAVCASVAYDAITAPPSHPSEKE